MMKLVALVLVLGPRAVAVGPLAVIDSVDVAKFADPTTNAALETRRPATRRLDKGSPPPPNNGDVDIFLQVGTMRTASTWQFMCTCLLAHLVHGLGGAGSPPRPVDCVYESKLTAGSYAELAKRARAVGSVLVVKTHYFALPPHTKPSALLFTTGTTQERLFGFGKPMPLKVPRNVALGTHMVYGDFLQNSILATVRAHARHFPGVSYDDILRVRHYLELWGRLRTCCGVQASKAHREKLHGLPSSRQSHALDSANCEIYDLDTLEEALFNTSLWRAHYMLRGRDFLIGQAGLRRGMCCASQIAIRRGLDIRGRWKPTRAQRSYIRAHSLPEKPPDHSVACRHRYYADARAQPLHCLEGPHNSAPCCPVGEFHRGNVCTPRDWGPP